MTDHATPAFAHLAILMARIGASDPVLELHAEDFDRLAAMTRQETAPARPGDVEIRGGGDQFQFMGITVRRRAGTVSLPLPDDVEAYVDERRESIRRGARRAPKLFRP